MAIQDWNGTAASEIKTLQDWDGTAAHKIGKVQDWDGTASHLIYSAEEKLADLSADATGGPSTTSSPKSFTSTAYLALTEYDSLTLTVTNNMQCYSWSSNNNYTKSVETHLVFADGTELSLGTAAEANKTVDLSKYSTTQKAKVYLKGTVYFSIDNVTNKAFKGAATATNVIAS